MNRILILSLVLFSSLFIFGCLQAPAEDMEGLEEVITTTQPVPAPEITENTTIETSDLPEIIEPINESEGDFPDLI